MCFERPINGSMLRRFIAVSLVTKSPGSITGCSLTTRRELLFKGVHGGGYFSKRAAFMRTHCGKLLRHICDSLSAENGKNNQCIRRRWKPIQIMSVVAHPNLLCTLSIYCVTPFIIVMLGSFLHVSGTLMGTTS